MRRVLSPRDLASAIGVSESSLKRWADAGRIHVARTDGGHRRIAVSDALRFVRELGLPIVRPELLGLPELPPLSDEPDGAALRRALIAGQAAETRALVLSRYLAGTSVAALFDGPLREALTEIGELWQHQDDGIFLEHRATDLCLLVVNQLRAMIEVPADAPVAVGGAPAGDTYVLPSVMAATVLADRGFRPFNLGADTPLAALRDGVEAHAPAVVWISAMVPPRDDEARALAAYLHEVAAAGIRVAVGGRCREAIPVDPTAKGAPRVLASMAELADYVGALAVAPPPSP
jgi:methanogenic corrinoid protein MtbC1